MPTDWVSLSLHILLFYSLLFIPASSPSLPFLILSSKFLQMVHFRPPPHKLVQFILFHAFYSILSSSLTLVLHKRLFILVQANAMSFHLPSLSTRLQHLSVLCRSHGPAPMAPLPWPRSTSPHLPSLALHIPHPSTRLFSSKGPVPQDGTMGLHAYVQASNACS